MDLTTITFAILVALGFLTVDSVMHSGGVEVEVSAPELVERAVIDRPTIEEAFTHPLWQIAGTVSMVVPPEVRTEHQNGIAMLLAERLHAKDLAFAVQREFGYEHDQMRFSLYVTEDGKKRGVVSGYSNRWGLFREEFTPAPGEPMGHFIERTSVWGASQLAPYVTALYLLQKHAGDGDFRNVVALCEHSIERLPVAPEHDKRGQFENLLGLVALFKKDLPGARGHFEAATTAWPAGVVPALNLAFVDLATDDNAAAEKRARELIANMTSKNGAVIGTTYMTLGAALMAQGKYDEADAAFTEAMRWSPDSSAVPDLWAHLKDLRKEPSEAARLRKVALQNTATVENYGELAALYFQVSWRDKEAITRSRFTNPEVVTLQ